MKKLEVNQMENLEGGACGSRGAAVIGLITGIAGVALLFTPAAPIGTSLIWVLTAGAAGSGTVMGVGCAIGTIAGH